MATPHGARSAFRLIVAGEALSLAGFLLAGWRADRAMDKSGLGDYSKFAYWSDWGGIAFWSAVAFWVCGTFLAWQVDRAVAGARQGQPLALLFGLGAPATFALTFLAVLVLA